MKNGPGSVVCDAAKKQGTATKIKHSAKFYFDECLTDLLEAQDIQDTDEKSTVCGALVALGLADHKMYSERNETLWSQKHHYTSTIMMKVLAAEYLYSTKHWAR